MTARFVLMSLAALATACAFPLVQTVRAPSEDASLDLVVVVRIAPGERERQHDVFVGIGKRGDNPARRYFHGEYTYLLAGDLDWRITWVGPDRVRLELIEVAGRLSSRRIAVHTFVRDVSGRFAEISEEGPWRSEAV